MSHDRGCPCGRESYEYSDCEDTSCSKRSKLNTVDSLLAKGTVSGRSSSSTPAESNAPKNIKYDSKWADAAERAEWAFMATALAQSQKLMSHPVSWIAVAHEIAIERSKIGWRSYDQN